MKRFLKLIILFLSPLFCAFGILEYGMRSIPNDYNYKNSWLEKNISHVRIWTFGSSHGYYGIDPKCFSKTAYNSAHVSQSLLYDAFIFNKFIEQADSLEWVVVPVSYFSIPSSLEEGEEWWRVKNYCLYYSCPYHKFKIKYHCEVIGNPRTLYKQIRRVGRLWIKRDNDIYCDSLGFGTSYTKDDRAAEGWYLDGAQRVKYHTKNLVKNKPQIQENTNALVSITAACADINVQVILLTTPVYSTYYNSVDSAQYALMVNTCESLASEYVNVRYLNLLRDARFVEDDFHDSDHLATEGAAKLTRILDEYISKASDGK